MSQSSQTESFLQTGLSLYAEAKTTLTVFEDELEKVVVDSLDGFLGTVERFAFKPTTSTTNRYWRRSRTERSPFMSVWRPGTLDGVTCELYLGVWWRPPIDEAYESALYVCFNDTGRVTEMCRPKRKPDHERIIAKDHRFLIPYARADLPDLAKDADLLLQAFAGALAP